MPQGKDNEAQRSRQPETPQVLAAPGKGRNSGQMGQPHPCEPQGHKFLYAFQSPVRKRCEYPGPKNK